MPMVFIIFPYWDTFAFQRTSLPNILTHSLQSRPRGTSTGLGRWSSSQMSARDTAKSRSGLGDFAGMGEVSKLVLKLWQVAQIMIDILRISHSESQKNGKWRKLVKFTYPCFYNIYFRICLLQWLKDAKFL